MRGPLTESFESLTFKLTFPVERRGKQLLTSFFEQMKAREAGMPLSWSPRVGVEPAMQAAAAT